MKHRKTANLKQRVIAFPRGTAQPTSEQAPEAPPVFVEPQAEPKPKLSGFARFLDRLSDRWCYFMHPDPLWPINGVYRCPQCLRTRPVAWGEPTRTPVRSVQPPQEIRQPQQKPAEPVMEPQLLRAAEN